jgi:hypothetical protein
MRIGIGVKLKEDFSVVRETLERIGIINRNKKEFYPSCYCVATASPDLYRIAHFKELFLLDGKTANIEPLDTARLKTIVYLLKDWNLVELIDSNEVDEILSEKITVLKRSEKKDYNIIHKFKFYKKIVSD